MRHLELPVGIAGLLFGLERALTGHLRQGGVTAAVGLLLIATWYVTTRTKFLQRFDQSDDGVRLEMLGPFLGGGILGCAFGTYVLLTYRDGTQEFAGAGMLIGGVIFLVLTVYGFLWMTRKR